MRALFLGIGNAQRGDDALGPFVANQLLDDIALKKAGVDILDHGGEGVSLMDLWQDQDLVVVVDAMKSGAKTGTVAFFDAVREPLQDSVFHYSSHLFGLAEAVEMARALDRLPKKLFILGVEGKTFDFGKGFSPSVKKALPSVVEKAKALLLGKEKAHA